MTRVNLVPVETLTRLHLIAEYAELPRVVALVHAAQARGETVDRLKARAPKSFTLGKGHALFFCSKLAWVVERYDLLVKEMLARGYSPTYPSLANKIEGIDPSWFGEYDPTPDEIAISQARIDDRVANPVGRHRKDPKKKSAGHEWDFAL